MRNGCGSMTESGNRQRQKQVEEVGRTKHSNSKLGGMVIAMEQNAGQEETKRKR